MADILVRGLEDKVVARLKARAARNGRSLQGEVKHVLERSAQTPSVEAALQTLRRQRQASGRVHTDSAEIVREGRQR